MLCCSHAQRKRRREDMQRQRALAVHKERRRTVDGCIACGVEVQPEQPIHVCGRCLERYTVCSACFGGHAHKEGSAVPHTFHQEAVTLEVDASHVKHCTTVASALEATLNLYANRPCLGFGSVGVQSAVGHTWMSYAEVYASAAAIGRGLLTLTPRGSVVCLFAEATCDWYLVQYGCLLVGLIVIPVLDNTQLAHLTSIVDRAPTAVIVASSKTLADAKQAAAVVDQPIRHIVQVGDPGDRPCSKPGTAPVLGISSILAAGKKGVLEERADKDVGLTALRDAATCRKPHTQQANATANIKPGTQLYKDLIAPSGAQSTAAVLDAEGPQTASHNVQLSGDEPVMLIPVCLASSARFSCYVGQPALMCIL